MKLKAKHDNLIESILNDPTFVIRCNGKILRKGKEIGYTKQGEAIKRNKAYMYLKYRGAEIKIHRIVYRKFYGKLDKFKVVHHLDGNGLNNGFLNLKLVSQSENCYFRYYPELARE